MQERVRERETTTEGCSFMGNELRENIVFLVALSHVFAPSCPHNFQRDCFTNVEPATFPAPDDADRAPYRAAKVKSVMALWPVLDTKLRDCMNGAPPMASATITVICGYSDTFPTGLNCPTT